jgi:chromosome segregation ATPase
MKREYLEVSEYVNKYELLLLEMNKIKKNNDKLNRDIIINTDNESRYRNDISELKKKMKDYEHDLKIIEIEKEEIYNRNEILEMKLEDECKKISINKKVLNEKEKEIKFLKKKMNELEDKVKELNIKLNESNEEKIVNINNDSLSINKNHLSMTMIKSPRNNNCLGNLYLDDNDDDDNLDVKIQLTSRDVIRKMSKKEFTSDEVNSLSSNYSTQISNNQIQNDVYKDFFLLTYQSFKLNSDDIEPYLESNPEQMYQKILNSNIPFHKVKYYLN